ncbi:hypothetical protein SNE40_016995 [Patella caerulea]|uniref:B box-type domain-containing protein n=1 Tax=Patella caerulea TaxID=87958 RepID=A0AAN8JEA2_PATCE
MGKGASKEKQAERDNLEQTLKTDPMDLIQKNYIVLTEHLDSTLVIDRLYQDFVLTHVDLEELHQEHGAQRKAKTLVILLRSKTPKQINKFIDIIKDIQPYLYNIMVSNSLHASGSGIGWTDDQDQVCEPCKEQDRELAATDWCFQCCEVMCSDCAKIHTSMKLLRHHSLKKLSDLRQPAKEGVPTIPGKMLKSKEAVSKLLRVNSGTPMPVLISGDKEGSAGATDLLHTIINKISILLVSDWHNESVKSFAEIGTKVKCKRLKMAGCPFRMTKISPNKIAVTMSNSFLITIINIGVGVLEKSSEILAAKRYDGICYLGSGKFAVSGETLDIINSSGDILTTIDGGDGGSLFNNPDYLTRTPRGDIVLSDHRNCRVVCVSQNGNINWVFQTQTEPKMECPHGVNCDVNGNVYVADWDRHNIILLSPEGTLKQILVSASNRLYRPRTVCTDDSGSRLFITEDSGLVKKYKVLST